MLSVGEASGWEVMSGQILRFAQDDIAWMFELVRRALRMTTGRFAAIGMTLPIGLILLVVAGCSNSKGKSPTSSSSNGATAPITNTDACAMRLHDISGALLMYYQKHHRLPDRLDELRTLTDFPDLPEFTCPVSRQPYIYVPTGISSPDPAARIVLYDATPAHDHHRWAVSIIEPDSINAPLVTKVIALPASGFRVPQASR